MCLITTFGVNCPACDEYEDKKQTIEKCQFFKVNKKCMNKKYETKYEPQICGEYQEVGESFLGLEIMGERGSCIEKSLL